LVISTNCFACIFDGNQSSAGTLTPTTGYQTQTNVSSGNYFTINALCGSTYNFTFCSNGGSAAWDTQITVLNAAGNTQLAYNDDACGLQSNISYTATSTGTIQVLISQYSCNNLGGSTGATLAYNVTGSVSSAFNLAVSCGGGTATVTGTTGGIFSFNPAPGDGAQVNSVTGTVSNGTAGTTYFVQYNTICGNSSIQSVTVVDEDCFTLNGTAQYISVGGEDCIQLTAEVNNQTGCAWSGSQIDFNSDFSLSLDYYFGNNINGADGNTFTFQPSSSSTCGQPGGQLGAGGIPNALSIEFDTYDNDNPGHVYDMACDHIAVEIDGNLNSGTPYCGPVCAKPGGLNIDDGGVYEVEIAWNAGTQQLDVYFNGALRLSCGGDFVNTVFGGQNLVYWGATSATGGLNNQQYFCPSTVVVLPVELASFTTSCENENEYFEWTTLSEHRVDYFQLEYTYDGQMFYPAEKQDAIGNSTQPINYSIKLFNSDAKQRYYRLKIVDENGDLKYTDLIAGNRCGQTDAIISKIKQSEDKVEVVCFTNAHLSIVNQLGEEVFKSVVLKNLFQIDTTLISSGIYYIHVSNEEGQLEVKKILVSR
jgi:hypothetical protein